MSRQCHVVAGVDEAGRGPLAGPVVVAAVVLDPARPISGLADSKKLGERRRNELAGSIRARALAWRVETVDVALIDEINILQATLRGMRLAVAGLAVQPDLALIDGNQAPTLACRCRTIIRGDEIEPAISAASILAKVERDSIMCSLHEEFPEYGFNAHKGYPTRRHLDMLRKLGPCPYHRTSYAPVRAALDSAI